MDFATSQRIPRLILSGDTTEQDKQLRTCSPVSSPSLQRKAVTTPHHMFLIFIQERIYFHSLSVNTPPSQKTTGRGGYKGFLVIPHGREYHGSLLLRGIRESDISSCTFVAAFSGEIRRVHPVLSKYPEGACPMLSSTLQKDCETALVRK